VSEQAQGADEEARPSGPEPSAAVQQTYIRATRFAVSCLRSGHEDEYLFSVNLEERSPGRWAVVRHGFCYDADGNAEYESIPSERADEFKERFRFDLDTAHKIAQRVAPLITVNGHTVADAMARRAAAFGKGDEA
jgi:hypothetical protein